MSFGPRWTVRVGAMLVIAGPLLMGLRWRSLRDAGAPSLWHVRWEAHVSPHPGPRLLKLRLPSAGLRRLELDHPRFPGTVREGVLELRLPAGKGGGIRCAFDLEAPPEAPSVSCEGGPAPVVRAAARRGAAASGSGGVLDLTRLPADTRRTVGLLLILPIGALLTALFRNVVGIRTFGVFTPSLLALSFVYGDWRAGLVVLALVLLAGFAGRGVLERLKLMVVPRLAVVLTLIVMCFVLCLSVLEGSRLSTGVDGILLPMVILALMVERAFIITEEDGGRIMLRLLAGTLALAAGCVPLMRWEGLGEWLVAFPEIHLVTLGFLLWIGRYSGYRLTELWRFHGGRA